MYQERLEGLDQEYRKLEQTLDDLYEQGQTLNRMELELLDIHRDSIRPILDLQYLDLSLQDEMLRQELMEDIGRLGYDIEEWVDEQREFLKKEEWRLEEKMNDVYHERRRLLVEIEMEEEKEKGGFGWSRWT